MVSGCQLRCIDGLTLSSPTLVAETGHQGGEEVGDGSDRVENLFKSAPSTI
jgi:hypothetical protein